MHANPNFHFRPLPLCGTDFHAAAEVLRLEKGFLFLDSRLRESRYSTHSYIAFEPFAVARVRGKSTRVEWWSGREDVYEGNAFDILGNLHRRFALPPDAQPPEMCRIFAGGCAGYLGYGLRHQVEALPAAAVDDVGIPEAVLGFYNFTIILDHEADRVFLAHFRPDVDCAFPELEPLTALVMNAASGGRDAASAPVRMIPVGGYVSSLTRERYLDAVLRIREYILSGDIYQANLTQRFSIDLAGNDPWSLYRNLMSINPAPFAAYLDFDDVKILSSSPERFLKVVGPVVETRPIKGTVRRGATPEEDAALRDWLMASEKNRAELAMIVDLMRNDIGRVCEIGSVTVSAFPEIETYASVHHLVSTVLGRLRDGLGIFDLLKATFPGGSITGAPKIRSMEIIDELEPVERGIYTGCIGWIGFNGVADLNIAIRTIVVTGGTAHLGAGGGIVMDSEPAEEYAESLLKARNLLAALGIKEASDALRQPV